MDVINFIGIAESPCSYFFLYERIMYTTDSRLLSEQTSNPRNKEAETETPIISLKVHSLNCEVIKSNVTI